MEILYAICCGLDVHKDSICRSTCASAFRTSATRGREVVA